MEYGKIESVSIIGYGRLGSLFHRCLKKVGVGKIDVLKRDDSLQHLQDVVLICVSDNEIRSVVDQILLQNNDLKGKIITHCSGTVSVSALIELEEKGAVIGCLHPMMAITEQSQSFRGVTFDVCGGDTFIDFVQSICELLEAVFLVVDEAQKKKLHIASVVASNYLVTLMHTATQIMNDEDLNEESLKAALIPLMQSALENLRTSTPQKALTGPIARADTVTISDHIELLKSQNSDYLELYKMLGNTTADMISDCLSQKEKAELNRLFDGK